MVVDSKTLEKLRKNYEKKKQKIIQGLDNKCILCGKEANSYHHLVPLKYSKGYEKYINKAYNLVPCCLRPGSWCHFKLNGVSWCFLSQNKEYFGKVPLEVLSLLIKDWIIRNKKELLEKRAVDLKENMKIQSLRLKNSRLEVKYEKKRNFYRVI